MLNEGQRSPRAWAAISYLLVPAAVFGLLWKGLRYRPYLRRWRERFAFGLKAARARTIWVHAVSVGEVRSSAPLISALMERYPNHKMLVTTMTPTGAEQVEQIFGNAVEHRYLPYDLPDVVARFLDNLRPSLAVIAETEFWPNLFAACCRRRIPLVLANVRISAHSLSGYLRVPATARAMFTSANLVCAQTRTDAQRLRNLGVQEHRLFVTGNLKFDVPIADSVISAGRHLRKSWGDARFVWVAGSTHAGEEERLLRAFGVLRARWSNLLLVLVPRDPERFTAVSRLVRRRGFTVARHSEMSGALDESVDVMIGDTMGHLQEFYEASDLAFVGASLVRRGGHNILEPTAVGVPVVFGPHMFNFEEIADTILRSGAGRQIYDEFELAEAVDFYIANPEIRAAAGTAGRNAVRCNQGSVDRTIELISGKVHAAVLRKDVAVSDSASAGIEPQQR